MKTFKRRGTIPFYRTFPALPKNVYITRHFLKLASCKSLRFKASRERPFEKRQVITSTLHALRIHVGQVGQIAWYSARFRFAKSQSPVMTPASNHRES